MAENNEKNNESPSPKPAETGGGKDREKVGDILKKERLTRRITVEAIAKDLKLNAGYVKAFESGDLTTLPPEPYIRVYLKSLTKYLGLDTEAILRAFDKERGLITDEPDKAANKIDISVQRHEKNLTLVIAAALIVALAVFAFVANKKGWLTSPDDLSAIAEKPDSTEVIDTIPSDDDSTLATLNAPETSAVATAKASKTPPKP